MYLLNIAAAALLGLAVGCSFLLDQVPEGTNKQHRQIVRRCVAIIATCYAVSLGLTIGALVSGSAMRVSVFALLSTLAAGATHLLGGYITERIWRWRVTQS
jgi:putative flippase GtrA